VLNCTSPFVSMCIGLAYPLANFAIERLKNGVFFLCEIGGCLNFNMPCSQLDTVFWRCLVPPNSVWKNSPVLKLEAVVLPKR
jgi:hypothetical protein